MPALHAYRALLRATGPYFLLLSFLARLPNGMGPLGVLTLVVATTGSYSSAGLAAGALGLAAAVGGPVVGWLADRYGQRPVCVLTAVLDAVGYLGVALAALGHAPTRLLAGCAALAGLATPQVGPLMRLRWVSLLARRRQPELLPTALAYEGAVDEVSFVAGPALVGLLALIGPPAAAILAAAGLVLVGGVGFALHGTAAPSGAVVPGARASGAGRLGAGRSGAVSSPVDGRGAVPQLALPPASVTILVLAMLLLGVVLGGAQTGVSALARTIGQPGAGGLIYAALGLGSASAGIGTAWLPRRLGYLTRYTGSAVALAVAGAGLLVVHSPVPAMLLMALLGLAVGPYLVTGYGLAERIAPPGRGGLVMTLLASGIVAGVAVGSALAGRLADGYGFAGAFWVPVAGGVLATLLAATGTGRLRRDMATDPVPRTRSLIMT